MLYIYKKFKLPNKTVLLRKDKRGSEDQGREIRLNYNITVYKDLPYMIDTFENG